MKKLSEKKLEKIYHILSSYDTANNDLIFDTGLLIEYFLENEIQDCIKSNFKNIDDKDFFKLFCSLNLNINIKTLRKKNESGKFVKFCINYSDFETFKKKYNSIIKNNYIS
ncbi:MAG: hypothetical protein K9M56_00055 [Victivallales bacterium]|nr:hypothetical protein [Victivallales bacterium]